MAASQSSRTCGRVPAASVVEPARRPRSGRLVRAGWVVAALVLLAGCAAGPNPDVSKTADAGFWLGLWQGIITPVTFVISLFTDNVNIYEVNNTGNWYDFGFVLGLSIAFGGVIGGARRR